MRRFFQLATPLFFLLSISSNIAAQIVPDASLPNNTTVSSQDNLLIIEGGTQRGNNLFHSFEQFSVPTGLQILFQNPSNIQNIFSRVSGGELSNIDGLIRANGNANLFLLNPNGIIFGTQASLALGGSFLASTAESIFFADGLSFRATNPNSSSLLSISVPIGLTLSRNSEIRVKGDGHNLGGLTNPFAPIRRGANPLGLAVREGQTFALIGGNLILEGGILTTEQGRIELGSVSQGTVRLIPATHGWTFGYETVSSFNDVHASRQSLVDASGTSESFIQVQGNKISLLDGSVFLIQHRGQQSAGDISVVASDSIELRGSSSNQIISSNIRTETLSSGQGADLNIHGRRVKIEEGAGIRTRTYGTANSGDLNLTADELDVLGTSPFNPRLSSSVNASTVSSGNSGKVSIFSERINITDGATLGSVTLGDGSAGHVRINAENIELSGSSPVAANSAISATTFTTGEAGSIHIDTSRLIITDNSTINTATLGFGSAGTIKIKADEIVVGPDAGILSSVVSSDGFEDVFFGTPRVSTGNSGSITIDTGSLKLIGISQIGVSNQGLNDNAGILTINAQSILLDSQSRLNANTFLGEGGNIFLSSSDISLRGESQISAISQAFGNGGSIFINSENLSILEDSTITAETLKGAGGNINLQGAEVLLNSRSAIAASTQTGSGGNVVMKLQSLTLENDSQIEASVSEVGTGGTLDIFSDTISLNHKSQLTATTQAGQSGNITLRSTTLKLLDDSQITTTVQDGDGGNINLYSQFAFFLNDSKVIANAFSGKGGNININSQEIFRDPNSIISASSELGIKGIVRINTTPFEVNPQPLKFSLSQPDEQAKIFDICNQVSASLSVQGKGGILPSPQHQLDSYTLEDLIPYGQAVSLQQDENGDWRLLNCEEILKNSLQH